MSQFVKSIMVNLRSGIKRHSIEDMIMTGDNLANALVIDVYDGETRKILVSGQDSIVAYAVRSDGNTVVITGSIDNGKAKVVLPEAVYAKVGPISIAVRLVHGSEKTVLAVFDSYVRKTTNGTILDPGSVVPDLTTLLAKISACDAATQNANNAAASIPVFEQNVVTLSDTQPTSEYNRIWVLKTQETEIQVPTMAEHNALSGQMAQKQDALTDSDKNTIVKNALVSSNRITGLTDTEKDNACEVIGAERAKGEWVLKGTMTLENVSDGVNVNFNGCTEFIFVGKCDNTVSTNITATANGTSVTIIVDAFTSQRKYCYVRFKDGFLGMEPIVCRASSTTTVTSLPYSNPLGFVFINGTFVSSITNIKTSNSSMKLLDIKIYAR